MKIHSKFRDYYDSAMAYGVDDHINWVRNVHLKAIEDGLFVDKAIYQEAPGAKSTYRGWHRNHRGGKYAQVLRPDQVTIFVGFCGKIYPGIRFSWEGKKFDEGTVYRTAYDTAGIIKILELFDATYKTKRVEAFTNKKKKKRLGYKPWRINNRVDMREEAVQKYFDKYSGMDYLDPFIELQVPIVVIQPNDDGFKISAKVKPIEGNDNKAYVNPPLTDFEFQKVMDPYTAYQEIEMFLGGVLTELDEIDVPGVGDKDLAVGKGFNEWSFKTLPTKHKKRGK